MTFNSWEFLLFYPIVALLYFVLPKKMKWPMLLVASYFFYMCYQAELVVLILGTTLVSFYASKLIEKTENQATKKWCLALTLIVCFGVLFFFKYFNFFASSVTGLITLFGGTPSSIELNLLLPVGISFYTFQTLSYVIDVYRGQVKTENNFFFYALYVSFFPQLVAGPIERPENLISQLKEVHPFDKENAIKGAKHMMLGFFKKVAVADLISVYVDSVYNAPNEANGFSIILATILFSVQIYCDFSGYTDIAIGCARIMGIRLMKNFDHPYMAQSIKEFWGRWHISLSSWFKDYLYFPLGGSRCSKPRHLFNLMVVFLVSGLWHGANWTYVLWGALHGLYQVIGVLTIEKRNALLDRTAFKHDSIIISWVRRFNTFVLVAFAWLFFRANSVSDAFLLLSKLFSCESGYFASTSQTMDLDVTAILTILASLILLLFIDRAVAYDGEDSSILLVKNGSFIYFVWIILFVWTLLLSHNLTSTFIYFQF